MPRKFNYKTVDEWIADSERRHRRNIRERIRGFRNVIRKKIGTAFLGDFLDISVVPHEDGPTEVRIVDTRRRFFYGPWYIKHDFMGREVLCRSALYEPKTPTYHPSSRFEQ